MDHCGVLLAAHGERGGSAGNCGVKRLAAALRSAGVADEVGYGFIKGTPTIAAAARALRAPSLVVYPLLLADGYFASVRLPQLLADLRPDCVDRQVAILPPLGLDPSLAAVVAARAARAARENRFNDHETTIVLLAHGSTGSSRSRVCTQRLAERIRAFGRFASVSCAFLDEAPTLGDVIARLPRTAVVVGLFAGEGLHGAEDALRLIAAGRPGVAFAGVVGVWGEIVDIVAAAVRHAADDCAQYREGALTT